jgi:hypothetical protein
MAMAQGLDLASVLNESSLMNTLPTMIPTTKIYKVFNYKGLHPHPLRGGM